MDEGHKYVLEDIGACCYKDVDELIDLYNIKALDYRYRDLKKGVVRDDEEYNNRTIRVIKEYAARKWSYRESWFE